MLPSINNSDDEDENTKFFLTQPQLDSVNIKIDKIIEKAKKYANKESLKTFTDTALLKKEVENEDAQQNLATKKAEFNEKMLQFKIRRTKLQKSKNELSDKCERFQKYIDENESKRLRAIQKFKRELYLKETKKKEFETLQLLYKMDEFGNTKLKLQIAKNEIYKDFMNKTISIMPTDFLLAGDKDIERIITRFNTLKETNDYLLDHSVQIGNKLEKEKCKLDEMRKSHENMKISILSKINALQNEYYIQKAVNDDFLLKCARRNSVERDRQVLLSKTFMVINSLADSCASFTENPSFASQLEDYAEKLNFVEKFILDKSYVCKLAENSTFMLNADITSKMKRPNIKNTKISLTN